MGVSGQIKDRHDFYYRKAKEEHYRARSVYKLEEIQQKFKLLRPGQAVLDLGAAPGSWTQYAALQVGPQGTVVAVDRTPIQPGLPPQVKTFQLDLLQVTPELLIEKAGVSQVDGVISDMAPNTSGIRSVDHARSIELCVKALEVADRVLKPSGYFICKVFQGADTSELAEMLKSRYQEVKPVKPKSSKEASVEFFLVGLKFQGAPEVSSPPKVGWDPLHDV